MLESGRARGSWPAAPYPSRRPTSASPHRSPCACGTIQTSSRLLDLVDGRCRRCAQDEIAALRSQAVRRREDSEFIVRGSAGLKARSRSGMQGARVPLPQRARAKWAAAVLPTATARAGGGAVVVRVVQWQLRCQHA
jgi:hypothetical protein